jgi:hypothetical protein
MLLGLSLTVPGCGGSVDQGVATGPEETTPAQTEEVIANEAESARNAAGGNQE